MSKLVVTGSGNEAMIILPSRPGGWNFRSWSGKYHLGSNLIPFPCLCGVWRERGREGEREGEGERGREREREGEGQRERDRGRRRGKGRERGREREREGEREGGREGEGEIYNIYI